MMAVLKKLADISEADIDSEIVVMRLDNGEFFSLSGTGASIWRLIDGKRDRDSLIEAAARDFHGNEDEISADIDALLTQLKEAGLLAGS